MNTRHTALVLFSVLSLGGLACSAAVQSGFPPLTQGCQTTADCASAGPAYQCVDGGGCEIVGCDCDSMCPSGLRCVNGASKYGQCLPTDAGTPVCP